MFYSNEFLKIQANKINDFIEKLADFHKYLVELQFNITDENKINNPNYHIESVKNLFLSLLAIDKSLVELGFFVDDISYNTLRDNFNSILNSLKDIFLIMAESLTNDYTENNIKNFGVLILNPDRTLYCIKKYECNYAQKI